MLLPSQVQDAIEEAKQAMLNHPLHILLPYYRQNIYHSFLIEQYSDQSYIYPLLALLTAQRVLPLWQYRCPDNSLPELVISRTEEAIFNQGSTQILAMEADEAWGLFQAFQGTSEARRLGNAFFAGYAATNSLYAAVGILPFGGEILEKNKQSSELGPALSDTAGWAAAAYAGFLTDQESDPNIFQDTWGSWLSLPNAQLRKEFWIWWLHEAIPNAWDGAVRAQILEEWRLRRDSRNKLEQSTSDPITNRVLQLANEINFEFPHSIYDEDRQALYYASHYEVRQALITPNEPIAVDHIMCSTCRDFFSKLALHRGKNQIVADACALHIFWGGETIYDAQTLQQVLYTSFIDAGLSASDWEEWSSKRLISALAASMPKAVRYTVFAGLLVAAGGSSQTISRELARIEQGETSLNWELVGGLMEEIAMQETV